MTSNLKRIIAVGVVVLLVGLGVVASRLSRAPTATIADASEILSAVQAKDGGTEPVTLPASPVLKNSSSDPKSVAVDFGYTVNKVPYAYRLALSFAPDADKGTMDLGAPHGSTQSIDQFPIERRWSESRKAYFIAVSHDLGKMEPPVPSLCVRAVVGPSKTSFGLQNASLCVMQRDQDGRCHPSTLACGLIR